MKLLHRKTKGQVTSSGRIQMCTRASSSRSSCGHSFSRNVLNCQDKILVRMTIECIFRIVHCRDFRASQFSTRPIVTIWGNSSSAHNFWTKGDMKMAYLSVCLVVPNRMTSNMTNFDMIWPVTSNWAGDQFSKFSELCKIGYSLIRLDEWNKTVPNVLL